MAMKLAAPATSSWAVRYGKAMVGGTNERQDSKRKSGYVRPHQRLILASGVASLLGGLTSRALPVDLLISPSLVGIVVVEKAHAGRLYVVFVGDKVCTIDKKVVLYCMQVGGLVLTTTMSRPLYVS